MKRYALRPLPLAFACLAWIGSPVSADATPAADIDIPPPALLTFGGLGVEWTYESCELPDDPNGEIPGCWWEIGWFVAETTICAAALGIPAFKLAKMGKKAKNGVAPLWRTPFHLGEPRR